MEEIIAHLRVFRTYPEGKKLFSRRQKRKLVEMLVGKVTVEPGLFIPELISARGSAPDRTANPLWSLDSYCTQISKLNKGEEEALPDLDL